MLKCGERIRLRRHATLIQRRCARGVGTDAAGKLVGDGGGDAGRDLRRRAFVTDRSEPADAQAAPAPTTSPTRASCSPTAYYIFTCRGLAPLRGN